MTLRPMATMRLDLVGPLFESFDWKMPIFFERKVPVSPNTWLGLHPALRAVLDWTLPPREFAFPGRALHE